MYTSIEVLRSLLKYYIAWNVLAPSEMTRLVKIFTDETDRFARRLHRAKFLFTQTFPFYVTDEPRIYNGQVRVRRQLRILFRSCALIPMGIKEAKSIAICSQIQTYLRKSILQTYMHNWSKVCVPAKATARRPFPVHDVLRECATTSFVIRMKPSPESIERRADRGYSPLSRKPSTAKTVDGENPSQR